MGRFATLGLWGFFAALVCAGGIALFAFGCVLNALSCNLGNWLPGYR